MGNAFDVPASAQTILRAAEKLAEDVKTGKQYEDRHLALRELVMEIGKYSEYEIWSTYTNKAAELDGRNIRTFTDLWLRALLNK
jgi:hypothetical protein